MKDEMNTQHSLRATLGLVRHGLLLIRSGGRVMRWRLETFGLYMPSYPHQRPWWAINVRVAAILARRIGRYRAWLDEMTVLRGSGAAGAWQHNLDPTQATAWRAWLTAQNAGEQALQEAPSSSSNGQGDDLASGQHDEKGIEK